jgi:hypothetical protein
VSKKKHKKKALLTDYPHVRPVRIKARGDGWARLVEDFARPVTKNRNEVPLTYEHLLKAAEYLDSRPYLEEEKVPEVTEENKPITTLPELKKACEDLKDLARELSVVGFTRDREGVLLHRCANFMLAAYQYELYLRAAEKPSLFKSYADNLDNGGEPTKTEYSTYSSEARSLEPTPKEARDWLLWRETYYPAGVPQENEWWWRLEQIMKEKAGRNVDSTKPTEE